MRAVHAAAGGAYQLHGLGRAAGVDVTAGYSRALGGEQQRGRPALATRGAGDQRDLALEPACHDAARTASLIDFTPP